MKTLHVSAISLLMAASAYARIINVPAEYSTIQGGIDASVNGDTVLAAPGTYTESLNLNNRNILLTSDQGPENVIIRGFMRIWGDSVDTTCVVRSLTLTTDGTEPSRALSLIHIGMGGLDYESPIIEGNILRDNLTYQSGGISCSFATTPIIRGNIIRSNRGRSPGGGISGSPGNLIEGNIISNNGSGYTICESGDAGGIDAGTGIVRYNLIIDNEAFRYICPPHGGGIKAAFITHMYIYNNTIVGNAARQYDTSGFGGGIYCGFPITPEDCVFKNNIVAFNGPGGGVYAVNAETTGLFWDYNLFFGNEGGDYIGIQPGPHDILADPLFVDRFSGDYHLISNSPCIDAGDPNSPLDPDGTRADIGAYYFDQSVGIDDNGAPSGPYQFALRQNYPNPFNGQTLISYSLGKESTVSLHIYSIMGHLVLPLVNKEVQRAGEHTYTWEGKDANGRTVSTGIYFYELYVNDYRKSKAMILIK